MKWETDEILKEEDIEKVEDFVKITKNTVVWAHK